MLRYLKEAFWARAELPIVGPLPVNALAVAGLGIFGFAEHALWLIGLGLETGYLYLIATNPRFQNVIDGQAVLQTRKRSEETRLEMFGGISAEARARFEQQEGKVREIVKLSHRANAESDDLLAGSNLEPLEKLCALHLRLLSAQARLQIDGTQDKETSLAKQAAVLEHELSTGGERFSPTLRESKKATLELTHKRLANAQKCREALVEIDSDLARIEAQLDLALENARLEGRPAVLTGNLNLLNQILESNSALGSLDASFLESEG